jgi:hypothetical protein
VPIFTGEKEYSPLELLVVTIDTPVPSLVSVTFAPAIVPPLVSLIVPEIEPVST